MPKGLTTVIVHPTHSEVVFCVYVKTNSDYFTIQH